MATDTFATGFVNRDSGDWINEILLNRKGLKNFTLRYAALVKLV